MENSVMVHSHAVLDHQRGESCAIDEDDAICNLTSKFAGLTREIGSGNNYSFPGPPSGKRAVERLYLRPANGSLPSLRLNENPLKTEPVKRDDTVNASIPRAPHALKVTFARAVSQAV